MARVRLNSGNAQEEDLPTTKITKDSIQKISKLFVSWYSKCQSLCSPVEIFQFFPGASFEYERDSSWPKAPHELLREGRHGRNELRDLCGVVQMEGVRFVGWSSLHVIEPRDGLRIRGIGG